MRWPEVREYHPNESESSYVSINTNIGYGKYKYVDEVAFSCSN